MKELWTMLDFHFMTERILEGKESFIVAKMDTSFGVTIDDFEAMSVDQRIDFFAK